MKKRLIAAAILIFALALTGCNAQLLKGSMTISQAKLTKQESLLKSLIQESSGGLVFDYTVGSEAKTVSIACFKLDENGKWVTYSDWSNYPVEQTTGRIAVTFDNLGNGMRSASQTGDSIYASENSTVTNTPVNSDEGMGSGLSYASTEKIEYEKEVPLAMQVFTTKDEINACDVSFFYDTKELLDRGYSEVYVVVAKFSKHELI